MGDAAAAEKRRTTDLEALLAREQAANTMLGDELAHARDEASTAGTALADARREFAGELEKLRISLAKNEHRRTAGEKRALMEIESERAIATRTRNDLVAASERLADVEAAHRAERDVFRDDLSTLKAQLAASQEQGSRLQHLLDARQDQPVNQRLEIGSLKQELHQASVRRHVHRTKTPVPAERRRPRRGVSGRVRGRVEFSVGPINRRPHENA